ncbi:hypothetical protein [Nocardioides mesophilus]|uniref:DUF3558 domain-containing protein n=1 Tax=Nocardioides mesophilus TaxID=433659 RepID=A0A7G9RD67_9ACTN|nr:hypothetical protein [Nocardioides mesophilus]QNN53542.1 hypothetical protein H9L09_03665 [Nocardioides mesophilus]
MGAPSTDPAPGRGRRARPGRAGRRTPAVLVALGLLGLAATTLVVIAGISGTGGDRGAGDPAGGPAVGASSSPSASLAGLDLSNLPLARAPFCDRIDDDAVPEVLAAPVEDRDEWAVGDRARLEPGLRDVAHEYGCRFSAGDVVADAWVFAGPVSSSEARRLVRSAATDEGCTPAEAAPIFGRPGSTTVCKESGTIEVTARGLFDDAWFTCRLTTPRATGGPAAGVAERAERWCVHVVTTVGARP